MSRRLTSSGVVYVNRPALEQNRLYYYDGESCDAPGAGALWREPQANQVSLTPSTTAFTKTSNWSNGRSAVSITLGSGAGGIFSGTGNTSLPDAVTTFAIVGTFTTGSTVGATMIRTSGGTRIFGLFVDATNILIAPVDGTTFAPIARVQGATSFNDKKFVYVVRYMAGNYRHTIYVQGVGTYSATDANTYVIQTTYNQVGIGNFIAGVPANEWGKDIAAFYVYTYKSNAEMDAVRDALRTAYGL